MEKTLDLSAFKGFESILFESSSSSESFFIKSMEMKSEIDQIVLFQNMKEDFMKKSRNLIDNVKATHGTESVSSYERSMEAEENNWFKKFLETVVEVIQRLLMRIANFFKGIMFAFKAISVKKSDADFRKYKDSVVDLYNKHASTITINARRVNATVNTIDNKIINIVEDIVELNDKMNQCIALYDSNGTGPTAMKFESISEELEKIDNRRKEKFFNNGGVDDEYWLDKSATTLKISEVFSSGEEIINMGDIVVKSGQKKIAAIPVIQANIKKTLSSLKSIRAKVLISAKDDKLEMLIKNLQKNSVFMTSILFSSIQADLKRYDYAHVALMALVRAG